MENNSKDFSIPRSAKPLLIWVLSIVFVSDVIFVFFLLMIAAFRNVIGVDSSMVGLTVVLFAIKTMITIYGLYKMMHGWLGVSYFVVGRRLIIYSDIREVASSAFPLKDLSIVKSDTTYRAARKTDYGDIKLKFSSGGSKEEIVLRDVKNPDNIAAQLTKMM